MTWDAATTALGLLAIDPKGLGGLVVRARSGPVRDTFLEAVRTIADPLVKLHPTMDDDVLFGGLDLTETLARGSVVHRRGLLGRCEMAVLSMAERCDATVAARIAMALDDKRMNGLIALDEGADADEAIPNALAERLALRIDLDFGTRDVGLLPDTQDISDAKKLLGCVTIPSDFYETLVVICVRLGIDSGRAAHFALRAARAHAALSGRKTVCDQDINVAVGLCLAHRATQMPPPPDTQDPPEQENTQDNETTDGGDNSDEVRTLDDQILEAVLAALPDGLLDQFKPKGSAGRGSGAGATHRGNRRGRPKPSRPGRLSGRNRLDLIATLRTAAPWQKLRGADAGHIKVAPSDFRIKQYEEKSDRLLIFAVDASGSAAIARLSEAKGAVELLLADAYSRRDHVSLVSFRGQSAETLLPPTRSLVQTKKRLAALPGGGGTPLAAGLIEALTIAHQAKGQGMTPCIVLLTDGRANIALDGTPDRPQAGADAERVAKQIRASQIESITLDLGNRPAQFLAQLASDMDGLYVPLPRADAHKVSGAVLSALGA